MSSGMGVTEERQLACSSSAPCARRKGSMVGEDLRCCREASYERLGYCTWKDSSWSCVLILLAIRRWKRRCEFADGCGFEGERLRHSMEGQ